MILGSAWTSFLYVILKHNRQDLEHKNWFASHEFYHVYHQAKGQGHVQN